jgi:hypothetical protein
VLTRPEAFLLLLKLNRIWQPPMMMMNAVKMQGFQNQEQIMYIAHSPSFQGQLHSTLQAVVFTK